MTPKYPKIIPEGGVVDKVMQEACELACKMGREQYDLQKRNEVFVAVVLGKVQKRVVKSRKVHQFKADPAAGLRRRFLKAASFAACCLLLSAFTCLGQQRGAFRLLTTPRVASEVRVKTNHVAYLTWDTPYNSVVYTGFDRRNLTNRFLVESNSVRLLNTNYGIAAISAAGVESALAYWPSNRIGRIELNEQGKTNKIVLERFTNSPAAPMRLWEIRDVTESWY